MIIDIFRDFVGAFLRRDLKNMSVVIGEVFAYVTLYNAQSSNYHGKSILSTKNGLKNFNKQQHEQFLHAKRNVAYDTKPLGKDKISYKAIINYISGKFQ